jgi:hypothetical protein
MTTAQLQGDVDDSTAVAPAQPCPDSIDLTVERRLLSPGWSTSSWELRLYV